MADPIEPLLHPPCPVCGNPTLHHTGDYEGHETDERCDRCGWYTSHSYGLYEELIGEELIGWTWTETEEERKVRQALRADALNIRRVEYQNESR